MPFVKFMSSPAGRALRFALGLGLMVLGASALSGLAALAVGGFGVIALLAGAFDFCLVGPLFGAPLRPNRGG